MSRIDFGADGPVIAQPAVSAPAPLGTAGVPAPAGFTDGFAGAALATGWEWPWDRRPDVRVAGGTARLRCASAGTPSFFARQVPADRFTARAAVLPGSAAVGLSAHGPGRLLRGIELRAGRVRAFRVDGDRVTLGAAAPAPAGAHPQLLRERDARRDGRPLRQRRRARVHRDRCRARRGGRRAGHARGGQLPRPRVGGG